MGCCTIAVAVIGFGFGFRFGFGFGWISFGLIGFGLIDFGFGEFSVDLRNAGGGGCLVEAAEVCASTGGVCLAASWMLGCMFTYRGTWPRGAHPERLFGDPCVQAHAPGCGWVVWVASARKY